MFKSTKKVPQLGIKLATYAFQAQFRQHYATPMPLEKILLGKLVWAQVVWHVSKSFVIVVMVMGGTSRRGCGLPPFPHLCCLLLPGPPKLPSVLHCSFCAISLPLSFFLTAVPFLSLSLSFSHHLFLSLCLSLSLFPLAV